MGAPTAARVRSLHVHAVADTGATMLVLPADMVDRLGLFPDGYRKVRYSNGRIRELPWVSNIRMTILGRETVTNALVEDAGTTPLIGQIPLEELDLIVDPKSHELRVNPDCPTLLCSTASRRRNPRAFLHFRFFSCADSPRSELISSRHGKPGARHSCW